MTRFVQFGGQTQYKPGGLTKINANALAPIGLTATGIMHLLGEADGGPPGTVGLVQIDDPALAKSIFRSGPLADAIRVAFKSSGDDRIPGGAFRVIAYKTNASIQAEVQLPGDEATHADTSSGASTTTIIDLVTGGLIVDAHVGRWLQLDLTSERRLIISNTATTVTVSPGFIEAPVITNPVKILDSQIVLTTEDYGDHTNSVTVEFEPGIGAGFVVTLAFEDVVERSDEIGGDSFLDLVYRGGAAVDSGVVDTSLDTTGATIALDIAAAPGLNAWAGMLLRFPDGTQRLIAGNTAADPSVVTFGASNGLSAAEQTAQNGVTAEVIDVTAATANITGASGKALKLTSTVAPVADNLDITFAAEQTLRQLVDFINTNTNYEASIPDGVNPDTTLMSSFDFGTRNTAVDVATDLAVLSSTKGMRRDLQVLVDWINTFSDLATAVKATASADEGSELPVYSGGVSATVRDVPVAFTGGGRGISGNSSFQAGFDALIETRANSIVALIAQDQDNEGFGSTADIASVAAQMREHVAIARTTGKNEQGGHIGFKGNKDAILAQLAALNDTDVQMHAQKMEFLDVDGNLKLMDEWVSGVAAASMRSGANEVGEPMTFKNIGTTRITQDPSWSPTSVTDLNQLLAAGLMFAEVYSGGVRWVRDITTHVKDDNIAFIDGNTREAVRFIAYDLRIFLEDRFTGLKATPATVASIREATAGKMGVYLEDSIIVESLDPETQKKTLPGFRALRVFIEGNVATVRVEIFPVTGIVYILNDINLQLPRLAG